MGKPWENGGLMVIEWDLMVIFDGDLMMFNGGFMGFYDDLILSSGYVKIAMENCHGKFVRFPMNSYGGSFHVLN